MMIIIDYEEGRDFNVVGKEVVNILFRWEEDIKFVEKEENERYYVGKVDVIRLELGVVYWFNVVVIIVFVEVYIDVSVVYLVDVI